MHAVVIERLEDIKQQQQEIKQQQQEIKQQQQDVQQFLSLVLRGQFKPASSGSSRDSKVYCQQAFAYYGYADEEKVQCMVTGEVMPCSRITAGHIFRQSWNVDMLVSLLPAAWGVCG
jgi:hypothetical protein